jgi:hypothetical protein
MLALVMSILCHGSHVILLLPNISAAGLRLRDIQSVDPALWITNSAPTLLVIRTSCTLLSSSYVCLSPFLFCDFSIRPPFSMIVIGLLLFTKVSGSSISHPQVCLSSDTNTRIKEAANEINQHTTKDVNSCTQFVELVLFEVCNNGVTAVNMVSFKVFAELQISFALFQPSICFTFANK